MHELAERNVPNERKFLPKAEALDLYRKANQTFKCELVEEKATEPMVSFYTTGKFIDFCRGPHIPSTGRIKAFKLMNVSGAYWKGKESNPQMQRVYGACFFTQAELDDYLHRLEEAKRRDHRRIGKELELFTVSDLVGGGAAAVAAEGRDRSAPAGGVHSGARARNRLPARVHARVGKSGPVQSFRPLGALPRRHVSADRARARTARFAADELPAPHPDLQTKRRSYRELPVRLAELGTMYRYERSGVLSGLSRVRSMTLNDAHIFCTPEQIKEEFSNVMKLVERAYRDLGITGVQLPAFVARRSQPRKIRGQR